MQRVRNFLIAQESTPIGRIPAKSTLLSANACEGWHKSWDTAITLMAASAREAEGNCEFVVIADPELSLAVAVFSKQNLESRDPAKIETKWTSVKIAKGTGFWCNFNYSDYGWGWVSGAEREVPFRLQVVKRKAETDPGSFLSRSRTWVRDWLHGRRRKTS